MSPAAKNPHDPGTAATSAQPIETIYTTVESQPDRTDWLTAVSNLRQINRQLVEEIARLEQGLASAKQSLHTHKEANQSHEITILQQQDELRIAHDRLGALFQQLETSHQIGQRQQTLIETLSQQLEIVQTIVPQIEAEHEQLQQKYQQQSQKLAKTEQVAVELHRRLKVQATTVVNTTQDPAAIEIDRVITEIPAPDTASQASTTAPVVKPELEIDPARATTTPDLSPPAATISDLDISTTEIDPAPPRSPRQIPQDQTSRWTPSPQPTPAKTVSSTPNNWQEEISSNNLSNLYRPKLDSLPSLTAPSSATANKESNAIDQPIAKSTPNWPAPTVNQDSLKGNKAERPAATTVKIDLPKFPKRVDH
jgi:hypothetical protein